MQPYKKPKILKEEIPTRKTKRKDKPWMLQRRWESLDAIKNLDSVRGWGMPKDLSWNNYVFGRYISPEHAIGQLNKDLRMWGDDRWYKGIMLRLVNNNQILNLKIINNKFQIDV